MAQDLEQHQARLTLLWEQLVHTLGVHSVNVLLDRAIWHVAQQYPALKDIQHNDQGLSFAGLEGQQIDCADDAFNALYDHMMLVLARLLGQDMARRLLDDLLAERDADESDTVR